MDVRPLAICLALSLALLALHPCAVRAQASDYDQDDVQACSGDAMRLCMDAMPDAGRIEACMRAKRPYLSKGCQARFVPANRRHRLAKRAPASGELPAFGGQPSFGNGGFFGAPFGSAAPDVVH